MRNELHTVLGGTGAIGAEIVNMLIEANKEVRSVTRKTNSLQAVNVHANLLDMESTVDAIEASTHVYLCIMVAYESKLWLKNWPVIMKNTIAACQRADAVLVFLDNTYMYGRPYKGVIDENYPQNAISDKGIARKQSADMLIRAMDNGEVRGVICRSSDFYGPRAVYSQFYIKFLENMMQDKNPQTLISVGKLHAYSYTQDVAKAMVLLAGHTDTHGQVWHVPTNEPVSILTITELFNTHLNKSFSVSKMPLFIRKVLQLFVDEIKEVDVVLYQFEHDTFFSSRKFAKRFPDFATTTYSEGIKKMITSFKNRTDRK